MFLNTPVFMFHSFNIIDCCMVLLIVFMLFQFYCCLFSGGVLHYRRQRTAVLSRPQALLITDWTWHTWWGAFLNEWGGRAGQKRWKREKRQETTTMAVAAGSPPWVAQVDHQTTAGEKTKARLSQQREDRTPGAGATDGARAADASQG